MGRPKKTNQTKPEVKKETEIIYNTPMIGVFDSNSKKQIKRLIIGEKEIDSIQCYIVVSEEIESIDLNKATKLVIPKEWLTVLGPQEQPEGYMTKEECIAWCCTEGSSGWQVSYKDKRWLHPSSSLFVVEIENYKRRTVDWNNGKPIYGLPLDFKIKV